MSDEAGILRAHLRDPVALCSALGLLAQRGAFQRQTRGVTVRCLQPAVAARLLAAVRDADALRARVAELEARLARQLALPGTGR